ncbi:putative gustatory receptor 58a isoform 2-T2 [Cochliomyia hominivorax]
MSHHLIKFLYNSLIKVTYYYSLVLGILSGKFNWHQWNFTVSKIYLIYSAIGQLFLCIIPLISLLVRQENNYLNDKPILQWTVIVAKLIMSSTVLVISLKIWQRRHDLINLFDIYMQLLGKYKNFLQYFRTNIETELRQQEDFAKMFLIYKFISSHLDAFAIASLYFQMQENPNLYYILVISFNMLQSFYLLTANLQFMLILCQMILHFSFINQSLIFLQQQDLPLKDLLNYYLIFYEMHMECLQLSRLFFKVAQTATIFMLLRVFTTNIILLYHAVLMLISNLESTTISHFVGTLCIVNFYWDTLLITSAIDKTLASGNRAAEILRETWHKLLAEDDVESFRELSKLLNQFSDYLACNKLEFCIYGLVNFDKASSFRYFVSALLHLIILVQFDLKNRLQVE